jgi:hypothetical protein
MAVSRVAVAAVAALLGISAAYDPPSTYAPKCRMPGERCMGAPGFPAVEKVACCATLSCNAPDTSYGGYGRVCGKSNVAQAATKPPTYASKCRAAGARCMGAPGFPYVDWIACCDGLSCDAPDTSRGGYGNLCSKDYGVPVATKPPTYEPKCRPAGERCMGAPGFPYVDWIACCDGMSCDAPDTSHGGYGKTCSKDYVAPPAKPPTYAPKCRAAGERCMGAPGFAAVEWIACCDGLSCNAPDGSYGGYGKVCSKTIVIDYVL